MNSFAELDAEQLETLHELESRLREALASETNPQHLARYYELLREVRARIDENQR